MNSTFKMYNATEFWHRENSLPSIPTFSQSLDSVLGINGLQLCGLTEILGLPGTGKTQLCLQLCASIQIPAALGGLSADTLYIDTNTNFTVCRFKEILSASISRCQQLLGISIPIRENEWLKKLHYVKAFGLEKFCAFMHKLPRFIADQLNVKLIVIDSITFPFKAGILAKQRTGLLFRLMAELQRLTVEKQIAVVLTNEMSTRLGVLDGSMVGSFGDAWAHRCNLRVMLAAPSNVAGAGDGPAERTALLVKTNLSMDPGAVARFQITQDGIRDFD